MTLLTLSQAVAQTPAPMTLPAPQKDIGQPVMKVFQARQSIREYTDKQLSPQELSNLLWAAWGVNRADGRRTAPSASNMQEIDMYVILIQGVYKYNAANHALDLIASGDHRKEASTRDFVYQAPVILAYVADFSKARGGKTDSNMIFAHSDAAFIGENVYLYCASQGLGTVIMGSIDRDAYGKTLKINENQFVTYAQPVGYVKSQ
jgi:SagB-type dehydrogenase family enzyme